MKKIWLLSLFLLALPGWAENSLEPLLNKVTLQMRAVQWVTTKTALVNVAINASVSDQNIEKVQSEVMQKLTQLATGEWHIVSFNRQQDRSGLESIQITAQARLQQTELGNLRDKAKNISKPGVTFTIDDVQFVPSEEEIKQANSVLRENIYQQVKAEIEVLNKNYPEQKFYLHQIDFLNQPPAPMPMRSMAYKMNGEASAAAAPPPLAVGNKTELLATIILAAMPQEVAQKLAQKI